LESNKMILYEYFDKSIKAMTNVAIDLKTNTGNIVKCIAPPGMFAKYLPIAEQMMNYFQISK